MEALLPSEIARLVLGYLEDQKCKEAARIFLETSPHLQECRTVFFNGRRFNTKISGLTLMDILEKFSAVNAIIQERLSKMADSDHLKHCGDSLEQLKFLIEETRGQRFVVNINVPSQATSQISNGSPIVSSSMRKRRHSNSDRDKCKRITKSVSHVSQQSETISSQSAECHTLEATQLESLSGHTDLLEEIPQQNIGTHVTHEKKFSNIVHETQKQYHLDNNMSTESTTVLDSNNKLTETKADTATNVPCFHADIAHNDKCKENSSSVVGNTELEKCTMGTSTEELLSFSSTEVQTAPYDVPESESESSDEPIENLSLLTKELLNRTELQERIAENINKAILPTETSLRDEMLNESMGGEINTSIMSELNNAIKSIVEATESDPVFEKFLDEIIGPQTSPETDTSPDEDIDVKSTPKNLTNGPGEKQSDTVLNNVSSPEPIIVAETRSSNDIDATELPLKHRLRSSSRQQNARTEDEVEKVKDQEKEHNALEDQNAAAILSIINANITSNITGNKTINDKKNGEEMNVKLTYTNEESEKKYQISTTGVNKNEQNLKSVAAPSDNPKMNNILTVTIDDVEQKVKKAPVKRPRPTKLKRDLETNANELISEQEIMAMPTLIVCSKEEISNFLAANPPYPSGNVRSITSTSNSHFIPITPKDPNKINVPVETVYLRAVNVAQRVPVTNVNDSKNQPTLQVAQRKSCKTNKRTKALQKNDAPVQSGGQQTNDNLVNINSVVTEPVEKVSNKFTGLESITLYSNENNVKTLLDGTTMPTISLDENISLSGTGLSPYFKFNSSKLNQNHNLSDIDIVPAFENCVKDCVGEQPPANGGTIEQEPSTSKNTNCDIINKRTPRSLLKSRSKNHRLSLSTPRRRSSHIRALDFNTPTKVMSTSKKSSANGNVQFSSKPPKYLKSVCRNSLFKSPPFSNATTTSTQKLRSPLRVCRPCKVPIATRSPAPKLMGGWEKCNGVGVIIGDVSPHRNTEPISPDDKKELKPLKTVKKSWDADLRKNIQVNQDDDYQPKISKRKEATKKNGTTGGVQRPRRDKLNAQKNVKSRKKTHEPDNEVNIKKSDLPKALEENLTGDKVKVPINKNNTLNAAGTSVVVTEGNLTNEQSDNISINLESGVTNKSQDDPKINVNKIEPTKADNASSMKPVKKYARLKTLKTNLRASSNEIKKDSEANVTNSENIESSECAKSIDITQHVLQMPDIIDLETPRKFDNSSGIPPTPRLLSPSSSTVTPFVKLCEDSSKMRSFISTPEFPTTPCITLTPKLTEDNTKDDMKKGEFNSCSPYYRPSSEENKNERSSKAGPSKLPAASPTDLKINSVNSYQACLSAKLEITQFEVIKENLPKEEAVKELKISSSSKDSTCPKLKGDAAKDKMTVQPMANGCKNVNKQCRNTSDKYFSGSENDSSDSDSSSSSDTSSSSSSSSGSTSSDVTNASSPYSSVKKCKRVPNKIYTDSSNDSVQKISDTGSSIAVNNAPGPVAASGDSSSRNKLANTAEKPDLSPIFESSPVKVFSIMKNEEEIKSTLKETPAKDDTLLEADISETPSSSKSGVENLTNLSSKITAFINSEDEKKSKANKSSDCSANKAKQKPKIVDIQHVQSNLPVFLRQVKTVEHRGECENNTQTEKKKVLNADEKLVVQLEEKRQRMIAKIRDIPKSHATRGRPRSKRNVLPVRNLINGKLRKHSVKEPQKYMKANDDVCGRNIKNLNKTGTDPRDSSEKKVDPEKQTLSSNVDSKACNKEKIFNKSGKSDEESKNIQTKLNITENVNARPNVIDNIACETGTEIKIDYKSDAYKLSTNEKETGKELRDDVKISDFNKVPFAQETNDTVKEEAKSDDNEKVYKSKEYVNHVDKAKGILKSKVDQVKRDLFSDEENDQRSCRTISPKVVNVQKNDKTNSQINIISAPTNEATDTQNSKELSSVLQCLQLIPACKNEYANEEGAQGILNVTPPNSVEYHFVYDDSLPVRKRRRYSGHELQFQVNVEPNDDDCKECFKLMTATEYKEIFNMLPKPKKKTVTKKSSLKNEKGIKRNNTKNNFILKKDCAKPLATSSPFVKSPVSKIKKIMKINQEQGGEDNNNGDDDDDDDDDNKDEEEDDDDDGGDNNDENENGTDVEDTDAEVDDDYGDGDGDDNDYDDDDDHDNDNDKDNDNDDDDDGENDLQPDSKKTQMNTGQEQLHTGNGNIKVRKRKLSESKENKQVEKKPRATDPQILLNNLDLDEFLTSVHGPA